jgi:hypothetical protein
LQDHSIDDLLRLLPTRQSWKTVAVETAVVKDELATRTLLVKPSELVRADSNGIEWLADRLIPRHGRRLVIAPPKTGKSLFFLDLALATMGSVLAFGTAAATYESPSSAAKTVLNRAEA